MFHSVYAQSQLNDVQQSNVHSVPTILQPKTQNMETNTDMGLKDLDKLEELQRVQKRLTSRELKKRQ
jgi:hypothetical protein